MFKAKKTQSNKPFLGPIAGHALLPVAGMIAAGYLAGSGEIEKQIAAHNYNQTTAEIAANTGPATIERLTSAYYIKCEEGVIEKFDPKTGVGSRENVCPLKTENSVVEASQEGLRQTFNTGYAYDPAAASRSATIEYNNIHTNLHIEQQAAATAFADGKEKRGQWPLGILFGMAGLVLTTGIAGISDLNKRGGRPAPQPM